MTCPTCNIELHRRLCLLCGYHADCKYCIDKYGPPKPS